MIIFKKNVVNQIRISIATKIKITPISSQNSEIRIATEIVNEITTAAILGKTPTIVHCYTDCDQ